MKKFLTRALPLCLALLIFVGSLAVPAFAAENDTYTITGEWRIKSFDESALPVCDYPIPIDISLPSPYNSSVVVIDSLFKNGHLKFMMNGEGYDSVLRLVGREFTVNNPFVLDASQYSVWDYCFEQIEPPVYLDNPKGGSIFAVFGGISGWIVSSIGTIMPMFYTEASGLTFIGTLAVAGLAFGVCFLVVAVIRRFLNFG